jgi:O-antigen ligase
MTLEKAVSWTLLALCVALPVSIAAVNIAAASLTVLILALDFSGKKLPWDRALTPLSIALMAYFLVAVAASLCGASFSNSLISLRKDFHKLWIVWLLLVSLRLAPPPRPDRALAAGFLLVAIVGIYQALCIRTSDGLWIRAHGFVHAVTYGQQMTLAVLGGLCILTGPDGEDRSRRLWVLTAIALIGAAFIFNQTRGALLGLAAGFGAASFIHRKLRRLSIKALAVIVVVCAIWELLPTGRSLIATFWTYGSQPIANQQLDRLIFWDVGWRMFRDHPWFGVGPGNYQLLFTKYFQGTIASQQVWGSAHNVFIHQAAERGMVGLAAIAAVFSTLIGSAIGLARRSPRPSTLWAAAGACAFLIMNLTEVSFQNEQIATLILFLWCWAWTEGTGQAA